MARAGDEQAVSSSVPRGNRVGAGVCGNLRLVEHGKLRLVSCFLGTRAAIRAMFRDQRLTPHWRWRGVFRFLTS